MPAPKLVTGTDLRQLARALADAIGALRNNASFAELCQPLTIVTPNAQMTQFLRIELSLAAPEGRRIAANLQLPPFGGYFAQKLIERAPGTLDGPQELQNRILAVLSNPATLQRPALTPVRAYLEAAGSGSGQAQARLCFQLAERMGAMFAEYGLSRPELLEAWKTKSVYGEQDDYAATETWQRALWMALHEVDDMNPPPRLLAEGWESWDLTHPEGLPAGDAVRLPPALFVFGFSLLSPGYHKILKVAAKETALTVYSCDRWAQVKPAKTSRQGDAVEFPADLWGAPGRDHLTLLESALSVQRISLSLEKAPATTLLQMLQQPALSVPTVPDGTLRFLSAPTLRREVEAVADEIWRLVQKDSSPEKPLRFHEIAVAITGPNAELYQAHIDAVFKTLFELPKMVVAEPMRKQSRAVEAMELLLKLPTGRFARTELLPLLTNAALTNRFPEADASQWRKWVDNLGVLFFGDRTDLAGTYITGDRFNWDQALHRLTMGAWLGGEKSGQEPSFVADQEPYRIEDYAATLRPAAGRFVLLVQSLIHDAKYLAAERRSLKAWVELLVSYVTTYLAPDNEKDAKAFWSSIKRIQALGETDVSGTVLSYDLALEHVLASIADLDGPNNGFLTSGIAVGTLEALAGFPFRAMYVVGLGEGDFPAKSKVNPLDLRPAEQRPSDIKPRERDTFLFLESLLSTQERLTLSWVGRDPETGDEIEPSGVIRELEFILEQSGIFSRDDVQAFTLKHRLNRYDADYFPDLRGAQESGPFSTPVAPAWRIEAEARLKRRQILLSGPAAAATEAPSLPEESRPVEAQPGEPIPITITLSNIRAFLEAPLQGWAKFVLGLEEEEEDAQRIGDEPVAINRLTGSMLESTAFFGAAPDFTCIPKTIANTYAAEEIKGSVPTGFLQEAVLKNEEKLLLQWAKQAIDEGVAPAEPIRVQFGQTRNQVKAALARPAILLGDIPAGGRTWRVSLAGTTETVFTSDQKNWAAYLLVASKEAKFKNFLKGFLTGVFLAADGLLEDGTLNLWALTSKEIGSKSFPALKKKGAQEYLQRVVGQMLGASHLYFMDETLGIESCSPNQNSRSLFLDQRIPAYVDKILNDPEKRSSLKYGPVTDAFDFPPPLINVFKKLVEDCYFFYWSSQGGKKPPQFKEQTVVAEVSE